jgi:hypothetical protein
MRSIVSASEASATLMRLCFQMYRGNRLKSRHTGNHHGSGSPKRNLIDDWQSLQNARRPGPMTCIAYPRLRFVQQLHLSLLPRRRYRYRIAEVAQLSKADSMAMNNLNSWPRLDQDIKIWPARGSSGCAAIPLCNPPRNAPHLHVCQAPTWRLKTVFWAYTGARTCHGCWLTAHPEVKCNP